MLIHDRSELMGKGYYLLSFAFASRDLLFLCGTGWLTDTCPLHLECGDYKLEREGVVIFILSLHGHCIDVRIGLPEVRVRDRGERILAAMP